MPKSGKNSQMSGSEQALEVAIVDVEKAAEVIRLATAAAFGKWRDDRKVHLTKTKRLDVRSSKDIPATLDGEKVNLGRSGGRFCFPRSHGSRVR
jgi:diacylglycerol kinase family enzyme